MYEFQMRQHLERQNSDLARQEQQIQELKKQILYYK